MFKCSTIAVGYCGLARAAPAATTATARGSSLRMSEVEMALGHVSEHPVPVRADDFAAVHEIGADVEMRSEKPRRAQPAAVRDARARDVERLARRDQMHALPRLVVRLHHAGEAVLRRRSGETLDDVIRLPEERQLPPRRRPREDAVRLARIGHPQEHVLRGVGDEAAYPDGEPRQGSEFHITAVSALAVGVLLDLEVAGDPHHLRADQLRRVRHRDAVLLRIVDVRPRRLPDELRVLNVADAEGHVDAPGAHQQLSLAERPPGPVLAGHDLACDRRRRAGARDVAQRGAGAETRNLHRGSVAALHEAEIACGGAFADLRAQAHVAHRAAAQEPVRGAYRVPEKVGSRRCFFFWFSREARLQQDLALGATIGREHAGTGRIDVAGGARRVAVADHPGIRARRPRQEDGKRRPQDDGSEPHGASRWKSAETPTSGFTLTPRYTGAVMP